MSAPVANSADEVREPAGAPTGILWVASYPKSGNTWTRVFLHNLLKILQDEDDGAAHDINRMREYTVWDISAAIYERYLGRTPKDCDRSDIARVRPLVQQEIAERTDGLAIVKTHHALVLDRGCPTINFEVTSGAVYVVRNPLDVAVSFASHMGSTIDRAIQTMGVRDYETPISDKSVYEIYGSWSQHVESWTRKPHDAVFVMRYEDMLSHPREAFAGLARHLLMRPTQAQLALAIERSSFAEMQKQENEAGFREKPDAAERFFRAGEAGQWRDALSAEQIRAIVETHHVQMRRFGYLTREVKELGARGLET